MDKPEAVKPKYRAISIVVLSLAFSYLFTCLPNYDGLSRAGLATLFILIFASILWVTSAIPPFAVSVLVIGLEVAILGRPGGVFAKTSRDWEIFISPWGSPVIWLFIGGLVMASAAQKSKLDAKIINLIMPLLGRNQKIVLFGLMAITFIFSMFMSNTATTAMMVSVSIPLIDSLNSDSRFRKAILLGIAIAANIGGMATVIGTPPNAIASGLLENHRPVNFLEWMYAGVPIAILMLIIFWLYLSYRFKTKEDIIYKDNIVPETVKQNDWQRWTVMFVFIVTIGLWISSSIHNIPATAIALIPITVFTTTGIIGKTDIRNIPWDVLLLLTGGLSLGVAVSETGLADWLVSRIPVQHFSILGLTLIMGLFISILSNFMSNTAAANIILPIAISLSAGFESQLIIPIAMSASAAMCLPISTPPNAIAYATEKLSSKDFLETGILALLLVPIISTFWVDLIF